VYGLSGHGSGPKRRLSRTTPMCEDPARILAMVPLGETLSQLPLPLRDWQAATLPFPRSRMCGSPTGSGLADRGWPEPPLHHLDG